MIMPSEGETSAARKNNYQIVKLFINKPFNIILIIKSFRKTSKIKMVFKNLSVKQ